MSSLTKIYDDIEKERELGLLEPWHVRDPMAWIAKLGEEFGGASRAALKMYLGEELIPEFRHELLKVAVIAINAIECIDRGNVKTAFGTQPKPTADRSDAG